MKNWWETGERRQLRVGEGTADLEARPEPAERLDRAAGLGDDVLHDREAEPGAPRGARAVGAEEALEEPGQLRLLDTDAVVGAAQDDRRPRRARSRA